MAATEELLIELLPEIHGKSRRAMSRPARFSRPSTKTKNTVTPHRDELSGRVHRKLQTQRLPQREKPSNRASTSQILITRLLAGGAHTILRLDQGIKSDIKVGQFGRIHPDAPPHERL